MKTCKKLLVIVPITRRGDEPLRAVSSIQKIAKSCIIVASFNRVIHSCQDRELLALLHSLDATILDPPNFLSPAQHSHYFISSINKILSPSRNFPATLLCDDDELILNSTDVTIVANMVKSGIALWGNYNIKYVQKDDSANVKAYFAKSEKKLWTRSERLIDEIAYERLNYNSSDLIQGSITGLIAPYGAFIDSFKFYNFSRGHHGARMECLILSWRNLKIARFSQPLARIYIHPNQSGRKINVSSYARDELRFRVYALLNCRSLNEFWILNNNGFSLNWILSRVLFETKAATIKYLKNLSTYFRSLR